MKTGVTSTSKESYRKLSDLSSLQSTVHRAIGELGTASNRDISRYLGKPVNEITPRVKELRDYGYVIEHGKKRDAETKRRVIAWCVTDPYAQKKITSIEAADDPKPVSTPEQAGLGFDLVEVKREANYGH